MAFVTKVLGRGVILRGTDCCCLLLPTETPVPNAPLPPPLPIEIRLATLIRFLLRLIMARSQCLQAEMRSGGPEDMPHTPVLLPSCLPPTLSSLAVSRRASPTRLKVALSEAFHSLVRRYGDTAASAGTGSDGSDDAPALVENAFLPREGVEAWLVTINRAPGRGSEFRAAEAIMGPVPGGGLTLEGETCICGRGLLWLRGGRMS